MFLQTGQTVGGDYSEETSREIDCEVREIIDAEFERARAVLRRYEPMLRKAAQVLLSKEVISGDELKAILADSLSDQGAPT
jgi:cell division protease FtsH